LESARWRWRHGTSKGGWRGQGETSTDTTDKIFRAGADVIETQRAGSAIAATSTQAKVMRVEVGEMVKVGVIERWGLGETETAQKIRQEQGSGDGD